MVRRVVVMRRVAHLMRGARQDFGDTALRFGRSLLGRFDRVLELAAGGVDVGDDAVHVAIGLRRGLEALAEAALGLFPAGPQMLRLFADLAKVIERGLNRGAVVAQMRLAFLGDGVKPLVALRA